MISGGLHNFAVFIVGKSRMAREAFCAAFHQIEPDLAFFPRLSVADIAPPGADTNGMLAVIYAADCLFDDDWVRGELAAASRAGIRVALLSHVTVGLEKVAEYVALGCGGFISTDFSFSVAVSAVKIVAAGELFVPAEVVQDAVRQEPSDVPMPAVPRDHMEKATGWGAVSWRERTVLELVCMGMPNKDIGNELGIATSTVKIHVSSIMRKLRVTNRTQLCALLCRVKSGQGS